METKSHQTIYRQLDNNFKQAVKERDEFHTKNEGLEKYRECVEHLMQVLKLERLETEDSCSDVQEDYALQHIDAVKKAVTQMADEGQSHRELKLQCVQLKETAADHSQKFELQRQL